MTRTVQITVTVTGPTPAGGPAEISGRHGCGRRAAASGCRGHFGPRPAPGHVTSSSPSHSDRRVGVRHGDSHINLNSCSIITSPAPESRSRPGHGGDVSDAAAAGFRQWQA